MIFYTEFENDLPWLHALNFFCPRICIHCRINKRDHGKFTLRFSSRTNQGLLMYLKKKQTHKHLLKREIQMGHSPKTYPIIVPKHTLVRNFHSAQTLLEIDEIIFEYKCVFLSNLAVSNRRISNNQDVSYSNLLS